MPVIVVDTGDTVMTRTWSWHPGSGLRDEISTGRVGKDNSRREDRVSKDMEVKKMSFVEQPRVICGQKEVVESWKMNSEKVFGATFRQF